MLWTEPRSVSKICHFTDPYVWLKRNLFAKYSVNPWPWMYNYNLTGYPQTLVWLMAGRLKCVMCPGSDGEQLHSECTGDSRATLVSAALIFPVQSKPPGDIPVPLVTVPVSSYLWSCSFLMWRFLRSRERGKDSSSTAETIRSTSLFSHFSEGYSA